MAAPIVFILHSDDAVRASVRFLLETAGWKVTDFSLSAELLANLDPVMPDCLVLDDGLSRNSAPGFAKELRNRGFMLPIVLMTARTDAAFRRRAQRIGVVTADPLSGSSLVEAVQAALSARPLLVPRKR